MENALRRRLEPDDFLFETIGFDEDGHAPRLFMHIERLCASARAFDIPFSSQAARDALKGIYNARVKLSLSQTGDLRVETFPRPQPATSWRIQFAADIIDSQAPLFRHKTNQRRIYDTARAALPDGIDELIYVNERGHVTEGTISNIFVDFGEGLVTPPISDGLLPGVLRRELIETKKARIGVVQRIDLPRAKAIYMGNSLRGLIPCEFV